MPSASGYLPYLPLLAPPILAAAYAFASRPPASNLNQIYATVDPGLASLPLDSPARVVYSEDWVEGGAYANLPMGRVRYWLVGPISGKKVVLIHGLSIPALVFQHLVPILVGAGYQVLLYDLYGRGYSDAPQNTPYDAHLYVMQLALLLQHVGWARTRLVGYSMGGAIAAAFVATFPGLVESELVLAASVGSRETSFAPFYRIRNMPFVEGWTMRAVMFVSSTFSSSPFQWLTSFRVQDVMKIPATGEESTLNAIVRLQATSLRGFTHAVISSLHEGPTSRMRSTFGVPAWRGRRVLFVHGSEDDVVPPSDSPLLRSLIDSATRDASNGSNSMEAGKAETQLVYVEGAGHDLPWTHAEEMGRAILEFLEGKAGK
ncbi:alpha/beta-hydrolase [Mycena alexandri]|uniref:Alpha/beta-hydrolase n=1 Tax=Mycena alexandri TaxID=1745969 RepID=A0AAD6SY25_9AGAR|nr:alpha/beta-hydrolase [Mycena alexandri]